MELVPECEQEARLWGPREERGEAQPHPQAGACKLECASESPGGLGLVPSVSESEGVGVGPEHLHF